jgi:hypothetical protein
VEDLFDSDNDLNAGGGDLYVDVGGDISQEGARRPEVVG